MIDVKTLKPGQLCLTKDGEAVVYLPTTEICELPFRGLVKRISYDEDQISTVFPAVLDFSVAGKVNEDGDRALLKCNGVVLYLNDIGEPHLTVSQYWRPWAPTLTIDGKEYRRTKELVAAMKNARVDGGE